MQNLEIERKFLVKGPFKHLAASSVEICQGYLSADPERTVRIRITNTKAFITVKGAGNQSGISRFEWEKPIELSDARELLKLCLPVVIEKTRYLIPFSGFTFEVDEFKGQHQGLVIAEVELSSENQELLLPEWIGQEVTGIKQYYNSWLSQNSL